MKLHYFKLYLTIWRQNLWKNFATFDNFSIIFSDPLSWTDHTSSPFTLLFFFGPSGIYPHQFLPAWLSSVLANFVKNVFKFSGFSLVSKKIWKMYTFPVSMKEYDILKKNQERNWIPVITNFKIFLYSLFFCFKICAIDYNNILYKYLTLFRWSFFRFIYSFFSLPFVLLI